MLSCGPRAGLKCEANPIGHQIRIVKGIFRDRPIGHGCRFAVFAGIDPLAAAGFSKARSRFAVRLQEDFVLIFDGDDYATHVYAFSAEHTLDRDRTDCLKHIFNGGVVHGRQPKAEADAGVSSTLSPQPQAEVWLGLLKVKPVRKDVVSKSICVPRR